MGLEEEIKEELMHRIIPFWRGLRDDRQGGFYSYMDFDLNVDPEYEKGCILNSRILWFFSNAAALTGDETLLEEAGHAYEFLKNYCMDREYGGVYWAVACNGSAADVTKHTYNQAFAIYALASYYAVTKKEEALYEAMKLFRLIEEKCIDIYGYLEAFTRDWKPQKNEKLSENGLLADKTMNTLLHVLEAYTELFRVTKDPAVGSALEKILVMFREKIYNEEKQQLEVFFDKKLHTISDLYSYGHDIEASWILDRACQVLGEEAVTRSTTNYTQKIAEKVYAQALNKDGSMNNECFCGKIDTTRVWWVQAEAMVGFYNCYEKTKDEKYKRAVEGLWKYVQTHLLDSREGAEWFWDVDENGVPVSKKPIVEPWKCPYHNGRMCIEILRRVSDAA